MKQAIRLTIMMVLLMAAAVTASAQGGYVSTVNQTCTSHYNGDEILITMSGAMFAHTMGYFGRQNFQCKVTAGSTLTFTCKVEKAEKNELFANIYQGQVGITDFEKQYKGTGSLSFSYKVPKGKNRFDIRFGLQSGSAFVTLECYVVDKRNMPAETPPTPSTMPESSDPISNYFDHVEEVPVCDCNVKLEGDRIDSGIRFNDMHGEVSIRPYWEDDDAYEYAEFDTPIYECDLIKTKEDSEVILGLEDMNTYHIRPESKVLIQTTNPKVSKFKLVAGGIWGNFKKMLQGKSIDCEMSHIVVGIKGTIVAFEEQNGVSKVTLFAGKVDVTSKKTKKKQVLQPGQTSSVGKDGKIVVKKFDIEQGAKKFGIPMSEIRNHYSNTTTTATTKRYDVERAMVKYKVTTGTAQGVMAKVFDKYGQQERRELKMGNQTTLQLTQGNNSYSLDTQAKTYTQVTNAELNFLNMNDPVMQKLKLKKKGTAKVLNRECTIYANSDTEFYVWKGIVLKKVAHTKKGITTTEATSVELPATVDAKYFKMPDGYTKK